MYNGLGHEWSLVDKFLKDYLPQLPEVSVKCGGRIGNFLIDFFRYPAPNSKFLLASHSIEQAALDFLQVDNSNVACAISDSRTSNTSYLSIHYPNCKRLFHSKLYMILSPSECICIAGSVNLTLRGLLSNDESVIVVRVTENSSHDAIRLVANAAYYFSNFVSSDTIFNCLPNWLVNHSLSTQLDIKLFFCHNLHVPILQQLLQYRSISKLTTFLTFSPIYTTEGLSLTEFCKFLNPLGKFSTFSQDNYVNKCYKFHRKVILFSYPEELHLFIGSPNASLSSFTCSGYDIIETGIGIKVSR